MDFAILGALQVMNEGAVVALGGRKQRAVLADLLVNLGRGLSADRLIFDLWGDDVPPTAAGTLQAYMSRLRKVLGADVISRDGGDYQLTISAESVDAARFEKLAAEALAANHGDSLERASILCAQALAMWRGPYLGELATEAFATAEAVRLEELRAGITDLRYAVELELGHHSEIIGELEAAVAANPFREQLWRHLMVAFYRTGRQADALRAYQRVALVLGEELGLEPGEELRALEAQILMQDPDLRQRAVDMERREAAGHPTNLRETLTSFVGRDAELRAVGDALTDHRLVTLVGPGGVGKTRLGVESAWTIIDSFPGGIWDADLATEQQGEHVLRPLVDALDIPDRGGETDLHLVTSRIAAHNTLVVLDNCEHMLEAAGAAASGLLGACANLRILSTSREPLGIAGEHVIRLDPLPVPDEIVGDTSVDSIRLFEARAASAHRGFRVTGNNAAPVSELVRRLDGMPLALELAAAQLSLLTPAQLVANLGENFPHLVGSSDDARHATLRATVDWSYDLLDPDDRHVFDQLSIFAGGFTEDLALRVVSGLSEAVVRTCLKSLVTKSLVTGPDRLARDGLPRFRMLETLRHYGRDRLTAAGTVHAARRRHAEALAGLAAGAGARFHAPDQVTHFDHVRSQMADLEAALRFADESDDAALGARLCRALWNWWYLDGHLSTGIRWLERFIRVAAPGDLPYLTAALSLLVAERGWTDPETGASDTPTAADLALQAAALAMSLDDPLEQAHVVLIAGDSLTGIGRYDDAEPLLEMAAAAFAETDVAWAHGLAIMRLVRVFTLGRADFVTGDEYIERSVAILEQAGDLQLLAYAQQIRANRARLKADYTTGLTHAMESEARYKALGFQNLLIESAMYVATLNIELGRYDDGVAGARELRRRARNVGNRSSEVFADLYEGTALLRKGDVAGSLPLLNAGLARAHESKSMYAVGMALLHLAPGQLAADDIVAAEASCTEDRAILSEIGAPWLQAQNAITSGHVAIVLGNITDARAFFQSAAAVYADVGHPHGVARSVEGLAMIHRLDEDAASVALCLGAAGHLRDECGAPPDVWERARIKSTSRWASNALRAEPYRAAWAEGAALAADYGTLISVVV